jgi:hypothetical protein
MSRRGRKTVIKFPQRRKAQMVIGGVPSFDKSSSKKRNRKKTDSDRPAAFDRRVADKDILVLNKRLMVRTMMEISSTLSHKQ